ncbi:MAG: TonB family protein [Candidatus Korobacteraceae bacterium]|jgi:TonB family protein
MASILIPPERSAELPTKEEQQLALWADNGPAGLDLTPHLLLQLEDDLERSRLREAFWISVVVHLLVVILIAMSPKIFGYKGIDLATTADLMKNQNMTYLDLPSDLQKPPKVAPKTNVLSDKNRVAMSQHPSIDKKTLEELRRAGPPGPPSQSGQMTPPAPQGSQQPNPSQQMAQMQPATPQANPRLPMQDQGGGKVDFAQMMKSQGNLAAQARAVAENRGSGGSYGGGGGDYGAGPGGSAIRLGPAEIISDTQGVDFGPYLSRVVEAVRRNWYTIIPEAARAPLRKRGKVAIEFAILPDGRVAGMKLTGESGDVSLDRAAWGGITASNPFAPLPSEYHAPYLALRFRFYYNPQKGDMD